jgi:arylsulfatase A-like enzyme
VLFIVWDDVGFAAMEPFGGLIETPNMKRLAEKGVSYTQFHTTALCSPTRACMLTGRNHTTVGMACIEEATTGFPGSSGRIPPETATLAEILVERGYNTYAIGKWHLTPEEECTMASSKRNWPVGRGFERFYGFLGGETDQWYPDLIYDNHAVEQPSLPKDGYHLSNDLVDKAISFIKDAKVIAPGKPFFMYFCPGCAHAPHHVFKEWADKYKGKFDMGYESYRKIVLEQMKKKGILPQETEMAPLNSLVGETSPEGKKWPMLDVIRPWDSLSKEEKKLFCRMAEVYAGFVSYTDHEIGRLLDYLEESGDLDNTIIVALSDNGASGEGGANGSVNENLFFNGIPDDMKNNLKMLDELGSENTYNHYPNGWAEAFCTPFRMYKRYAAWSGGTCDPLIVSWPEGIKKWGRRHQYHHVVDIVPTILDCLELDLPEEVKGYTQKPLEGVSMRYSFDEPGAPTKKEVQYYNMLGSRGIWKKGWKISNTHPTIADWGRFEEDRWLLFNTDKDRAESHDLAKEFPEKVEELKSLWYYEAGRYNGLPIEDRGVVEIFLTPRPQPAEDRDRYRYFEDNLPVPESVGPKIVNRSYKIGAAVDIPEDGAQGVLLHQGSRFGGHALYVKDKKLHYVYNFVGLQQFKISSTIDVPVGEKIILAAVFDKEKEDPKGVANGTVSLFINEKKVGEGKIRTQPSRFGLTGYVVVGQGKGAPVCDDFPGERPWTFTGKIHALAIDVSGKAYRDIESEVQARLKSM